MNAWTRPTASLSLDLDDKWSYLKTHGDASWQTYPSYLNVVVPRALEMLARRDARITFFIVGRDASFEANRGVLRSIADAGHEIGNHSFSHEPWFDRYTRAQIESEIAQAEEHLEDVTGQRPIGFRGPGFSITPATLEVLAQRGYAYDASVLPTFIGPLARAYYFKTSKLTEAQKEERKGLFGGLSDGLRPLSGHLCSTPAGTIVEVPVTTMPFLKIPIHISYVIYLAQMVSPAFALRYFELSLNLCAHAGIAPSILLHPLDILGRDDVDGLSFFPGMSWDSERKIALVEGALTRLAAGYQIVTVRAHAHAVRSKAGLRDASAKPLDARPV